MSAPAGEPIVNPHQLPVVAINADELAYHQLMSRFGHYAVELGAAVILAEHDYRAASRRITDIEVRGMGDGLDVPVFRALCRASDYHALQIWEMRQPCEFDLHNLFKSTVAALLPGAEIVPRAKGKNGLCDFLVRIDGQDRPVEIKIKVIDQSAVRQLRRYMEFYQADVGYAAAPALRGTLPDDMRFIQLVPSTGA
jgi:hypothetical protein